MTQVVTSYQIEFMSGGREVLKWIVERSYEGYELKSLVQNHKSQDLDFLAIMQRPIQIADASDGWQYPTFED